MHRHAVHKVLRTIINYTFQHFVFNYFKQQSNLKEEKMKK